MTDKRIKMDCPFCGHDKSDIQLTEVARNYKQLPIVKVYCPNCGVQFIGLGKQNVINLWNRRAYS